MTTLAQTTIAITQGVPDPDTTAHLAILADIAARIPATCDDAHLPAPVRLERMHWLITTAHTTPMDPLKLARWTGYVQGVCAVRGWLDADEERERTRPVLHAAAIAAGRAKPASLGPDTLAG